MDRAETVRITIKDVARLANVSRATVYRALEDKPGINPKTKQHIIELAASLNYQPNRLGKALAKNEQFFFGVVTLPLKNPFSKKLLVGINEAESELLDYGVRVKIVYMEDLSPKKQSEEIYRLIDEQVKGITIDAINGVEVLEAVNSAVDAGIPVITFNSDIAESERLCFVGQKMFQSGQVAGDLLSRFMGEAGVVFVLNGFHKFVAHRERLRGFNSVINRCYPNINVVAVEECLDDDLIAYEKTMEILEEIPEIRGVYVVGAGVSGLGKALKDQNTSGAVKVVCNDLVPETVQLLKDGVIDATIYQDPVKQGKLPIRLLFELLFENKRPEREFYYTKTEIITQYLV
jgi:LacI family transcriptional regulator